MALIIAMTKVMKIVKILVSIDSGEYTTNDRLNQIMQFVLL